MYRFLLHDALTGVLIAEGRPTSARWADVLNGGGTAQVAVPIATLAEALPDPIQGRVGKTFLTVVDDATPKWSGLWWSVSMDLESGLANIAAANILSVLARRIVRSNLSYASIDQATIAAALVNHAQSTLGGTRPDRDLRISTAGVVAHGVQRTAQYLAADSITIGEALSKLGQQDGGFDYAITPTLGAAMSLSHALTLTFPNTGAASGQTLIHRANCRVRALDVDAAGMLTDVMARGKDGLATLRSSPIAGFPAMEENRSWSDEAVLANLQDLADRALIFGSEPLISPSLAVLDSAVPLAVGQTFRLVVPGYDVDATYRVVQSTFTLQAQAVVNELVVVNAGVFTP